MCSWRGRGRREGRGVEAILSKGPFLTVGMFMGCVGCYGMVWYGMVNLW